CLLFAIRIDVEVDVRSESESDAPISHPQIRIELRNALKRFDRRFMIEAVQIRHPLIEILLRLGTLGGADREMNFADALFARDSQEDGKNHSILLVQSILTRA